MEEISLSNEITNAIGYRGSTLGGMSNAIMIGVVRTAG